jgi:hypothetical protein
MRDGGKEVTRWILLGLCSVAVLSCGSEPQPVEPDPGAYGPFEAVRFCQGTHSTSDLERWFAEVNQAAMGVEGFVFFDNDEAVNCLRVGVSNRSAGEQIEAALLRLGIPRDAVIIEFAQPVYPADQKNKHT